MKMALNQAKKAYEEQEMPIGAVIVKDGKVIAKTRNSCEKDNLSLAHAELKAIKKASKVVGDWRLNGCVMYVTLEPCKMCVGAITASRIDKVIFGAFDKTKFSTSNGQNQFSYQSLNHTSLVYGGLLQEDCSTLITSFFKEKRCK